MDHLRSGALAALLRGDRIRLDGHAASADRAVHQRPPGEGAQAIAVKQLRWAQVDFDDGLLHLDPEEREQTSKRRPVMRMPPSLIAYLRQLPRESDHVVSFRGRPVDRYYTALGESRRRVGLDERVNLDNAWHTVARWLRKQRAPFEEVAGQLGHRVLGFGITEIYAAYSPDYQALATAAIERLLQAIAQHAQSCRFPLRREATSRYADSVVLGPNAGHQW